MEAVATQVNRRELSSYVWFVTHDPSRLLDAAVPLLAGAVIAVGITVRTDGATRTPA